MALSQFRALPATDRLLALALTMHEDRIDPSHGQPRDLAMDPDLADEWVVAATSIDYAALAMAEAAEKKKDTDHPGAFRYLMGLKQDWEERKAAKVAARLAGDDAPEAAMPTGEFAEIFFQRTTSDAESPSTA